MVKHPYDADVAQLSPVQRLRIVHRMLIPPVLSAAIEWIEQRRTQPARAEWHFAALDRTYQWAISSAGIADLREHILASSRLGDAEAVQRAFVVLTSWAEEGRFDTTDLGTDPLHIAAQVIGTWRQYMREGPEGPDFDPAKAR